MQIGAIFWASYIYVNGYQSPDVAPRENVITSGRFGLLASCLIVPSFTFLHAMRHFTEGPDVISGELALLPMGPMFATLIYLNYFLPYQTVSNSQAPAIKDFAEGWPRLRMAIVGLFASIGIVASLTITGIMLSDALKPKLTAEQYEAKQKARENEARTEIEMAIAKPEILPVARFVEGKKGQGSFRDEVLLEWQTSYVNSKESVNDSVKTVAERYRAFVPKK
jgi:hypothetical protein